MNDNSIWESVTIWMQLYLCSSIITLNGPISAPPPPKKAKTKNPQKTKGYKTPEKIPLFVAFFYQSFFNKYLYSILMKAFDALQTTMTPIDLWPWPFHLTKHRFL